MTTATQMALTQYVARLLADPNVRVTVVGGRADHGADHATELRHGDDLNLCVEVTIVVPVEPSSPLLTRELFCDGAAF